MDRNLLLIIVIFSSIIITFGSQLFITIIYGIYSKYENKKKINGKEAAKKVLESNNLSDINIEEVSGYLSDHFDPRNLVIRLSRNNYQNDSIASVAVSCHECGHAIQNSEGYKFMRIRSAIIPFVNFSSSFGYIAILIGFLFDFSSLFYLGIFFEVVILLFQIITLPVEFDASKKALKEIEKNNLLEKDELKKGRLVLIAAALTYVASVATTILEILRLIISFSSRKDD